MQSQKIQKPKKKKELTGRHVLLMLIAFFGVTVGVNTIFITKAVSSFSGEDVKGSYRQGLEYNKTLESRSEQAALGWTIKTNLVEEKSDKQRLVIRITDSSNLPLTGLSINGVFKRPTDLDKDEQAVFSERGNGIYEINTVLSKGQWTLKAIAASPNQSFRFEDRFVISK